MRSTVSLLSLLLMAGPAAAQDRAAWFATAEATRAATDTTDRPVAPEKAVAKKPAVKPPEAKATEPDPDRIRTVPASNTDPIRITTKLRYQTLVVLPDDDPIVEILAGDGNAEGGGPGNWVISKSQPSTVHIKPTAVGLETNLNVVTTSGAIYSFLIREGRPDGKPLALPDLRVNVTTNRPSGEPLARKYYTAAEYEALQGERQALRAQLDVERTVAGERLSEAKRRTPDAFHFAYRTPDGKPLPDVKPFRVKAVFHDGRFSYIRLEGREKPTLYEVKGGEASVVEYQLHGDTYVVQKVLERAYLALGKERFEFALKDASGN